MIGQSHAWSASQANRHHSIRAAAQFRSFHFGPSSTVVLGQSVVAEYVETGTAVLIFLSMNHTNFIVIDHTHVKQYVVEGK